ncbi:posterior protein-like [Phyllobates terribilis]|uniref:posterior protein-like n=1 Tax=Phyllobates terribilis TaxID=111132 RepID=UPI003CCB6F12
MELVEKYVKKYASAIYHVSADKSLEVQYKDLVSQCKIYNNKLNNKVLSKKLKKEKLSNAISVLLKMKELSEMKEASWWKQRLQIKEDIDKISDSVIEISDNTTIEMDGLRSHVDELDVRNEKLEEQLKECRLSVTSHANQVFSLELKNSQMEKLIATLERQLGEAKCQLHNKEQHIQSLTSKKCSLETVNVCTLSNEDTRDIRCSAPLIDSAPLLTISEKLYLCQLLGKFDSHISPVLLSNRFEAVVQQYSLNNKNAWSLFQAWLPGPLAAQLSSAHMSDNCKGAELRRKELQCIIGGRDTRGENALAMTRFRRHDDPLLFCNNYLALYRTVYNCLDMSQDDANFLYSMANHCNVDYTTRVSLRNSSSYGNFVNILRDWCNESKEQYETSTNISAVHRTRRRGYVGYCYGCGRPGHIKRYCNTPYMYPEPNIHSFHQGIDSIESDEEESTSNNTEFTETCEQIGNIEADPATPAPDAHTMQSPNANKDNTRREQDTPYYRQPKEGANIPVIDPRTGDHLARDIRARRPFIRARRLTNVFDQQVKVFNQDLNWIDNLYDNVNQCKAVVSV